MIQELQARIERYVSEGKNRSLHSLAAKAGVSYSTLTRISQGKGNSAGLPNVLAILKVVSSREERSEFIKEYFPGVDGYLEAMAQGYGSGTEWTTDIESALEQALYDAESFHIISLARTPRGTTKKDIVTQVGPGAVEKLLTLLETDVLKLEDGRYFTAQPNFSPINNLTLCAEIGHMFKFIRPSNVGKQRQHCAVRTNGISREAQVKLHACIQNALIEADKIIDEGPGDIPVFLGAVMGMLTAGEEK